MSVPADLLYSKDHEWIRVSGSVVRIGITDFAQDSLGDVVFVQLPNTGTVVSAGESFSEVESTKSVSDIYAPVSGTVSAVNDAVDSDPSLINSDPYGQGWLCEITMSDPQEIGALLSDSQYTQLIAG